MALGRPLGDRAEIGLQPALGDGQGLGQVAAGGGAPQVSAHADHRRREHHRDDCYDEERQRYGKSVFPTDSRVRARLGHEAHRGWAA
jgi:hypothetical protein